MKVTFDTKADPLDEVLRAVQAGYGVAVSVAGGSDAEAPQGLGNVNGSPADELIGAEVTPEPVAPAVAAENDPEPTSDVPVRRPRTRAASGTKAGKAPTGVVAEQKKAAQKPRTAKSAPAKAQAKQSAIKKTGGPQQSRVAASGRGSLEAKPRVNGATKKKAPEAVVPSAAIVRNWAREQGMDNVSSRGKLSASLYEAYAAAHA